MIYGVDISTSIVGLAQFHNDGAFVRADHCDLRRVEGLLAKADAFREFVSAQVRYPDEENHVFVEERLGNFAAGRTMLQTLMKLAAFNAVCSYILWRHEHSSGGHRGIIYLHPSTWKSILRPASLVIPKGSDKKALTLEFVRRVEPDFDEHIRLGGLNRNGNPQPWCYDEADAYCLGKAGYLRLCKERASSPPSGTLSATRGSSKETSSSPAVRTRKGAPGGTPAGN